MEEEGKEKKRCLYCGMILDYDPREALEKNVLHPWWEFDVFICHSCLARI